MKFHSEVTINRPVKEVYRFTVSHKNLSKWIDGFEAYRAVKGRNRSKGSKAIHVYKDAAGKLEVNEEVLDLIPEKSFVTKLSHKNMDTRLEFRFLDQGNRTKIIADANVRLKPPIFNLFSFFMKSRMKEQQQADLRRLKHLLEASK